MKFLTNEWFDTVCGRVYDTFRKPGKYNITFCEIFENCPGDDATKWMYYVMEKGVMKDIRFGTGANPDAEYVGRADYKDHIRCCMGELDPKKAVMSGVFKIQDNAKDGGPMKTLALINMYMKLTDAKRVPGIEF